MAKVRRLPDIRVNSIGSWGPLLRQPPHTGSQIKDRQSIRRGDLERMILDGLRQRLMAPELVEEFVRDVHKTSSQYCSHHCYEDDGPKRTSTKGLLS